MILWNQIDQVQNIRLLKISKIDDKMTDFQMTKIDDGFSDDEDRWRIFRILVADWLFD